MVIMKKLYILLLFAAVAVYGCDKKAPWGDPGEISDIHAEGVEYGVKVVFTAPLDHEDYYYTLISYEDSEGKPRNVRVSRFDADANGVTEAIADGLREIKEYSFTARPYSYGGVSGAGLSVTGTPISPDQVGYLLFNLSTVSNNASITKVGDFAFHIETTGLDPNVQTIPLDRAIEGSKLTYNYKASAVGAGLQIFFIRSGQPVATWAKQSTTYLSGAFADTADWTYMELDLSSYITQYGWGNAGDALRLDFGNASGATIDIDKMLFRK